MFNVKYILKITLNNVLNLSAFDISQALLRVVVFILNSRGRQNTGSKYWKKEILEPMHFYRVIQKASKKELKL